MRIPIRRRQFAFTVRGLLSNFAVGDRVTRRPTDVKNGTYRIILAPIARRVRFIFTKRYSVGVARPCTLHGGEGTGRLEYGRTLFYNPFRFTGVIYMYVIGFSRRLRNRTGWFFPPSRRPSPEDYGPERPRPCACVRVAVTESSSSYRDVTTADARGLGWRGRKKPRKVESRRRTRAKISLPAFRFGPNNTAVIIICTALSRPGLFFTLVYTVAPLFRTRAVL